MFMKNTSFVDFLPYNLVAFQCVIFQVLKCVKERLLCVKTSLWLSAQNTMPTNMQWYQKVIFIYLSHKGNGILIFFISTPRQWWFLNGENLNSFTVGENVINLFVFDALRCIVVGTLVLLTVSWGHNWSH